MYICTTFQRSKRRHEATCVGSGTSGGARIQEQVAELTVLTPLLGCLGSDIGLFWSQCLAQSRQNNFIFKWQKSSSKYLMWRGKFIHSHTWKFQRIEFEKAGLRVSTKLPVLGCPFITSQFHFFSTDLTLPSLLSLQGDIPIAWQYQLCEKFPVPRVLTQTKELDWLWFAQLIQSLRQWPHLDHVPTLAAGVKSHLN